MGNSYFQFKQFRIDQHHAAMKVSTDACIQGAWTPAPENAVNALDIGCGTGLLTLMLAQRYPQLGIDAVEIDQEAAKDAASNFMASPWNNRIQLLQGDAREVINNKQYNLIICNPPFFNNSLLGPSHNRNTARHTVSLSHRELSGIIKKHLSPAGCSSVLLPTAEAEDWNRMMAGQGFKLFTSLAVQPRQNKPVNRLICVHTLNTHFTATQQHLTIYNNDGTYTSNATQLLSPFYLHL